MPSNTNNVNLTYLTQFTRGDREKLVKYVNMYLKSAPQVIGEFQQLLNKQEYDNLRLKAHSIKPQAQYFGIDSLKEVLVSIETTIKDKGDLQKLPLLVEQAMTISDQVIIELEEILELENQ